jgi:hypothetical protein
MHSFQFSSFYFFISFKKSSKNGLYDFSLHLPKDLLWFPQATCLLFFLHFCKEQTDGHGIEVGFRFSPIPSFGFKIATLSCQHWGILSRLSTVESLGRVLIYSLPFQETPMMIPIFLLPFWTKNDTPLFFSAMAVRRSKATRIFESSMHPIWDMASCGLFLSDLEMQMIW